MKVYKDKFALTTVINLSFLLTICYYSSMEVYIANYNEFAIPISYVWWTMLFIVVAITVVSSAIESLLPSKILMPIYALTLSIEICFWVQSLFLNGEMETFYGDETVFSTQTKVLNLILWGVIIAIVTAAAIIMSKKDYKKTIKCCIGVAGALIIIQGSGIVTSALSLPEDDKLNGGYFSSEGEFTVSEENNTIVFIIDTCDGRLVESTLKQYPDLFDGLDGFTYYPNMTTTYSRTYPSIVYLLTHEKCYFDVPYNQYIEDAYNKSNFLEGIKEVGTDIRIFTEPSYLGTEAKNYVDNYKNLYTGNVFEDINIYNLFKGMMHLSGYKEMPYVIKSWFIYDTNNVNMSALKNYCEWNSNYAIASDDAKFFSTLLKSGVSSDSSCSGSFRFYHLSGVHPGIYFNEQLIPDGNSSRETTLYADLKAIKYYISELKRLDVYDKSTIIITADHGNSFGLDNLEIFDIATCLMLAKPSGENRNEIIESFSPVCHDDIFHSIYTSFGLKCNYEDGYNLWDIPETMERKRYYNYSALYSDEDGEVALREYLIDGDATDFSNWHLTGNYWDINYSQRAVSKHRLSEVTG